MAERRPIDLVLSELLQWEWRHDRVREHANYGLAFDCALPSWGIYPGTRLELTPGEVYVIATLIEPPAHRPDVGVTLVLEPELTEAERTDRA